MTGPFAGRGRPQDGEYRTDRQLKNSTTRDQASTASGKKRASQRGKARQRPKRDPKPCKLSAGKAARCVFAG